MTDRLAYLNFVQGSLASSIAVKLDAARAPLKQLRDAEVSLTPRRNIRAGLQNQLARLEHDNAKGMEKKISELKDQIRKADADDQPQEREVELLKRKGIRESEQAKWDAIREVCLSFVRIPFLVANMRIVVWRKACFVVTSCKSRHCSVAHPSTHRIISLQRCTSYGCGPGIVTACPR